MKIICFDIGGTKILKTSVELQKNGHKFLEIEEEKNPKRAKEIKKILTTYRDRAAKKFGARKIAISAAYIVDQRRRTISGGKICYGVDTFDCKFLEKRGFEARVENDGRCFALGECRFGKGKGKEIVLGLTLGTEVGGGLIISGKNYRGAHSSSLETSYMKFSSRRNFTEWRHLVVGRGLERCFKEATGKKTDAKSIFLAAGRGNKTARKVIERNAVFLGVGIANLLDVLDPEIVVFGGSMSGQKIFVKKAVAVAKRNAFNKKANYRFAISTLGNKANLLGAASLYL